MCRRGATAFSGNAILKPISAALPTVRLHQQSVRSENTATIWLQGIQKL